MGGNMSWPRFRRRNHLIVRPNYYSDAVDAPPKDSGYNNSERDRDTYLSGEIDRMVYGYWLSDWFTEAVAKEVGITQGEVLHVISCMLTWETDSEPDPKYLSKARDSGTWGPPDRPGRHW